MRRSLLLLPLLLGIGFAKPPQPKPKPVLGYVVRMSVTRHEVASRTGRHPELKPGSEAVASLEVLARPGEPFEVRAELPPEVLLLSGVLRESGPKAVDVDFEFVEEQPERRRRVRDRLQFSLGQGITFPSPVEESDGGAFQDLRTLSVDEFREKE